MDHFCPIGGVVRLCRFTDYDTETCATATIAVLEHVRSTTMLEYVGMLDHVAVPALGGHVDTNGVPESAPANASFGLGGADAVTLTA